MDYIYGIVFLVFAQVAQAQQMTTCRLASQSIHNDARLCVYVGANRTYYTNTVPYDAGVCPPQYSCVYRPNSKGFNLKNVVKNIKDTFKGKD